MLPSRLVMELRVPFLLSRKERFQTAAFYLRPPPGTGQRRFFFFFMTFSFCVLFERLPSYHLPFPSPVLLQNVPFPSSALNRGFAGAAGTLLFLLHTHFPRVQVLRRALFFLVGSGKEAPLDRRGPHAIIHLLSMFFSPPQRNPNALPPTTRMKIVPFQ